MATESYQPSASEASTVEDLGPRVEDDSIKLSPSRISSSRTALPLRARTNSSDSRYSQVSFVRSQPVGLPSSSMPSPRLHSPSKMESELSRRHTVHVSPSRSGNPGLKRSDSLPTFPPDNQTFKQDDPFRLVGSVDDLPVSPLIDNVCWRLIFQFRQANPKTWSPSQRELVWRSSVA